MGSLMTSVPVNVALLVCWEDVFAVFLDVVFVFFADLVDFDFLAKVILQKQKQSGQTQL